MSPVFCSDCDHVHPASRDAEKPWNWRCLKFPRPSGYGFVHPSYSPQPPYRSCRDVNFDGLCSAFTPRAVPTEERVAS
jgi:hypothetical protein